MGNSMWRGKQKFTETIVQEMSWEHQMCNSSIKTDLTEVCCECEGFIQHIHDTSKKAAYVNMTRRTILQRCNYTSVHIICLWYANFEQELSTVQ